MKKTIRKRVWFTPFPIYGHRAVAIKRRIGWSIIYHFPQPDGMKCFHHWTLSIKGPNFVDREDYKMRKDLFV